MYTQLNKKQYRTKGRYTNQSRYYKGDLYDSIREANHAEELDWKLKNGEIKDYTRQHKIDLRVNGVHIAHYRVDFRVVLPDDSVEYHEVKGMVSADWQLKWRLLEAIRDEIEPGVELVVIK